MRKSTCNDCNEGCFSWLGSDEEVDSSIRQRVDVCTAFGPHCVIVKAHVDVRAWFELADCDDEQRVLCVAELHLDEAVMETPFDGETDEVLSSYG